ncbi:hypothetical protein [Halosegnis longus]|uniref:hypothetical protein n=1 Tax=Halosegnis longus TaxID=2216012 RepID=UPI001562AB97|nr:hypothetical protein [Halosegnis longus]
MRRDTIEPMVPRLPTDETSTTTARADGGQRKPYDADEVEAALVPLVSSSNTSR